MKFHIETNLEEIQRSLQIKKRILFPVFFSFISIATMSRSKSINLDQKRLFDKENFKDMEILGFHFFFLIANIFFFRAI